MKCVDLSKFSSKSYKAGGLMKRCGWYLISILFFKTNLPYPYGLKRFLLRLFGANVGKRVFIKPNVNIKYPWFLEVGDNVWIGEGVWLDNLAEIKIKNNVCISQGAYILTGNHNYKKETFDLILKPVLIENGVWVGSKVVVCPGVTLNAHAVITAGGVISKDAEAYTIYKGNPAQAIRERKID